MNRLPIATTDMTDCQICVLESIMLDGPAPTARLQDRLPAYNAMAGIPRPQWFTPEEVQIAIDQLFDAHMIRWDWNVGWRLPAPLAQQTPPCPH